MSKIKYCPDCKYFDEEDWDIGIPAVCQHDCARHPTGGRYKMEFVRSSKGKCGVKGKYWVKRDPKPVEVKRSWFRAIFG